ncbi:MAG: hypothetical protein M3P96_00525 [Actinomycetota bacterium]|nr:hypothetical protein [Actinomycetota bacterium]
MSAPATTPSRPSGALEAPLTLSEPALRLLGLRETTATVLAAVVGLPAVLRWRT